MEDKMYSSDNYTYLLHLGAQIEEDELKTLCFCICPKGSTKGYYTNFIELYRAQPNNVFCISDAEFDIYLITNKQDPVLIVEGRYKKPFILNNRTFLKFIKACKIEISVKKDPLAGATVLSPEFIPF